MSKFWNICGDRAALQGNSLSAVVDVSQPDQGLVDYSHAGQEIEVSPFGVSYPQCPILDSQPPFECYARGCDLVAVYAQTPQRAFRPQIYWRLCPGEPDAVEIVISVQTSLLDAQPAVDVQTMAAASQVLQLDSVDAAHFSPIENGRLAEVTEGPGCFLFRLNDARQSYVEMIPPSDMGTVRLTFEAPGRVTLAHRLFTRSLEKGVILRGRHRACIVPREDDMEQAAAAYRALLASRLPLTT